LRVHREGYHSEAAIASELAWLTALRRDGAAITPVPHAGRDGKLIQSVAHAAMARPRNVVLFDWEQGTEPSESDEAIRQWFEVLGETTARMHGHVRDWTPPHYFTRLTWDFDTSIGNTPHWGRWRDGMGLNPERVALFQRTVDLIGRRLERFGKAPERFGLIHCDMRLANLLIDGDVAKVIDFDDCGFSWLLYDCATTVSFFEHNPEVPDLLAAWVSGYRKVAEPCRPRTRRKSPPSSCCAGCCWWRGSARIRRPNWPSPWACPTPRAPSGLCEDYLSKFG
jgi:Ser/Thr protein kinase RdoA (MazF antagonist)